jgi:hypothetical protein
VLTGLMVLAAAVGVGRALVSKSRGVTWFLGAYGVAMLVAAVFPADPVDGFPPGTPEGFPTSISTTGLVHFAAGGLGFACLAVSGFAAAWEMARRGLPLLAVLSLLSGLAVVLGFFGGMVLPIGIQDRLAVVAGWFVVRRVDQWNCRHEERARPPGTRLNPSRGGAAPPSRRAAVPIPRCSSPPRTRSHVDR